MRTRKNSVFGHSSRSENLDNTDKFTTNVNGETYKINHQFYCASKGRRSYSQFPYLSAVGLGQGLSTRSKAWPVLLGI